MLCLLHHSHKLHPENQASWVGETADFVSGDKVSDYVSVGSRICTLLRKYNTK